MSALTLPLLDPSNAPEPVAATLASLQKRYGFLPNLYRAFANAPAALDAYLAISEVFQRSTLSATERNVVLLTAARENGCTYCVAVHSTVADMQKDNPAVTDAIRDGRPIDDRKLESLRLLAASLVRERGHAPKSVISGFVAAGYSEAQVLEVLVGVTLKTLSNYTNHLAEPPLDAAFAARTWAPSK